MDEEFAALLFFFGISLTANLGLAFAWFRANRRGRRFEDIAFSSSQPPDDRRVDRLEQTLDALSGQMDQLANGQEFLNRVMAERLERLPKAVEPERLVTPH